ERVADMIAAARARRVSVGRAGARYFLLMAGVGLDAELVRAVSPGLKRLTGQGAYWVAGLGQLVDWRPRRFLAEVEERQYGAPRGAQRILEGLTEGQAAAVTHEAGPLLIIAGAGTGKTTVITRRIAYLIATRRARPSEILALTFTDKAAVEMEERVDTLVPYGYADVQLSTFHAFGDRLIKEHALELGLTPDFRVLTRAEQVIFLRDHLFEFPLAHYRPLGDPTRH